LTDILKFAYSNPESMVNQTEKFETGRKSSVRMNDNYSRRCQRRFTAFTESSNIKLTFSNGIMPLKTAGTNLITVGVIMAV